MYSISDLRLSCPRISSGHPGLWFLGSGFPITTFGNDNVFFEMASI